MNHATIKPYQVKALVIAAKAIYDQLKSAGATSETFDEWRADICASVTGQRSFKAIPAEHLPRMQRILGVPVAKPRRNTGPRLGKGQYYLRRVLEETGSTSALAAEMCRRLYGHGDYLSLGDTDARQLGHIIQRKRKSTGRQ